MRLINRTWLDHNVATLNSYGTQEFKVQHGSQKETFIGTLNKIQPVRFDFSDRPRVTFRHERLQEGFVRTQIASQEVVNSSKFLVLDPAEQARHLEEFDKALELLKNLSPALSEMIESIINTVFICQVPYAGGGSTTSYISLVWLSPKKDWTTIVWAENLFHEFTHNSLFLDDMINAVFPDYDSLFAEDAMVTSSILKRKRPYDKAFHSAAVSISLMFYYELLGDKKRQHSFYEPLRVTVTELVQIDDALRSAGRPVISDHGRELLREMRSFINEQDYNSLLAQLSTHQPSRYMEAIMNKVA